MRLSYLVMALGGYMLVMGLLGFARTQTTTPLFINGTIGLVTFVIGYLMLRANPVVSIVALIWVGLNAILLSYMTFKRIAAHETARAGSEYIFGSQALFAIIILILLIRERLRVAN